MSLKERITNVVIPCTVRNRGTKKSLKIRWTSNREGRGHTTPSDGTCTSSSVDAEKDAATSCYHVRLTRMLCKVVLGASFIFVNNLRALRQYFMFSHITRGQNGSGRKTLMCTQRPRSSETQIVQRRPYATCPRRKHHSQLDFNLSPPDSPLSHDYVPDIFMSRGDSTDTALNTRRACT